MASAKSRRVRRSLPSPRRPPRMDWLASVPGGVEHEGFIGRRASQLVGAEAWHEAERVGDAPLLQVPDRRFGDRVAGVAERKHRADRLIVLRLRADEDRKLLCRARLRRRRSSPDRKSGCNARLRSPDSPVAPGRRIPASLSPTGAEAAWISDCARAEKTIMPPKLWPTITRSGFPPRFFLAVAIMAQPPEQLPHRTHRHALSSRLPAPRRSRPRRRRPGRNSDRPRQPTKTPRTGRAATPAEARVLS